MATSKAHLTVMADVLVVSGCQGWKPKSVENGGTLCFGSELRPDPSQSVALKTDTPMPMTWVGECIGGEECSRNLATGCAVSVSGSVVTLTSSASWEDIYGVYVACTAVCRIPSATCELPALPAGTYTLRYGGSETTLQVPSTVASCPFG